MIEKEIMEKLAKLARLRLSEQEISKFSKDLDNILSAFQSLEDVNTDNIEPSFQPFEIKNVTREDIPGKSIAIEDALKNAEQKEGRHFKGPRAI